LVGLSLQTRKVGLMNLVKLIWKAHK